MAEVAVEKAREQIAKLINAISHELIFTSGVIQPISEIEKIVHQKGGIFMTDATQSIGKINVDMEIDGIDLLC